MLRFAAGTTDLPLHASIDIHEFHHSEAFDALNPVDENTKTLFTCSTKKTHISTSLTNGRPQFLVFHASEISEADAALQGHALRTIVWATYSSLGLEMKGLAELDEQD